MDRSDRVRSRSATPSESARWWVEKIGVDHQFDVEEGVAVGSRAITIVLTHGKPDPNAFGNMALHLPSMDALRAALTGLHERGVELEDPGDEIGPETEGPPNMGWWFRDLDGYRWESGVPNGAGQLVSASLHWSFALRLSDSFRRCATNRPIRPSSFVGKVRQTLNGTNVAETW